MMKWIYAFAAVALFASSAFAIDVDESEEGDARLGYININGGTTSLSFNATSIQNAVILGLFILVLGALLLPLFGQAATEDTGYGYGYEQTGYSSGSGYEEPAAGYGYQKRSVRDIGVLMSALHKYDDDEE